MTSLRSTSWWTPADEAELDVLVHELVDLAFNHREAGCEQCLAREAGCLIVRGAIDRVDAWRADRMLRSRAAWLRAHQDARDEAVS